MTIERSGPAMREMRLPVAASIGLHAGLVSLCLWLSQYGGLFARIDTRDLTVDEREPACLVVDASGPRGGGGVEVAAADPSAEGTALSVPRHAAPPAAPSQAKARPLHVPAPRRAAREEMDAGFRTILGSLARIGSDASRVSFDTPASASLEEASRFFGARAGHPLGGPREPPGIDLGGLQGFRPCASESPSRGATAAREPRGVEALAFAAARSSAESPSRASPPVERGRAGRAPERLASPQEDAAEVARAVRAWRLARSRQLGGGATFVLPCARRP